MGGDTIFVEVSAKKGVNIDYLLEMILWLRICWSLRQIRTNRQKVRY